MTSWRMGLGWVVACGACAGGGSSAGAASVRDSAGVRIVENSQPGAEGWVVAQSPQVDIGGQAGDEAYDFGQVVAAYRLGDGRIAVGNGATFEIRFYDTAGVHAKSVGRQGSGPGEYQNMSAVLRGEGDSLLVIDMATRRITVLDDHGATARSFSLGGASGVTVPTNGTVSLAIPTGVFTDGSILGVGLAFKIGEKREGIYRDSAVYVRYGPDGAVADTLGRQPSLEMETMQLTFGTQSFSSPTELPLGKTTHSAVHGGSFYLAKNYAWEIEGREADGTLKSLIRFGVGPKPITSEDQSAHRKEQLRLVEEAPQFRGVPDAIKTQIRTRVESATYPATFPFILSLLSDREGNLWAQEPSRPGSEVAQQYLVVDSAGRIVTRVTLPVRFRPLSLEADAVIGVWRDADDVEHIRIYRILKGESP